jgi:hypothetical protein
VKRREIKQTCLPGKESEKEVKLAHDPPVCARQKTFPVS